jgi:hypothetical protein
MKGRVAFTALLAMVLGAPLAVPDTVGKAPVPRPRPQPPAPLVEVPLVARVGADSFDLPVMSAFVLPGAALEIEMAAPPLGAPYELAAKAGTISKRGPSLWTWHAPEEAGRYDVEIKDPDRGRKLELRAFVMVPATQVKHGRLNGYRIGDYPANAPSGNPAYERPPGFIEVTKDNDDTHLTPHFRLKQFVCKQPASFPKYVVLNARLLLKLEAVLAAVNEAGFKCDTLHVMSGYRTPFYNAAIENVKLSQHVYGHASDVFIDTDDDGLMDDLDHDGKLDRGDSKMLFDIVDRMDRQAGARLTGGLGLYGGTRAHGPFVHVDVRGRLARW